MIESHRDRVKTSTAVRTRGELELAHPRDERLAMCVTLDSTDVAHLGVVSRVVRAAAALAPPLPPAAATVKLGHRLEHPAPRAAPGGVGTIDSHCSRMIEQTF